MSRALDTYPDLTDEQKVEFRDRCVEEKIDPKERCPLCRGRRLTTEPRFAYCKTHHSWQVEAPTTLVVACHNCRVRWAVLLRRTDEHGCVEAAA